MTHTPNPLIPDLQFLPLGGSRHVGENGLAIVRVGPGRFILTRYGSQISARVTAAEALRLAAERADHEASERRLLAAGYWRATNAAGDVGWISPDTPGWKLDHATAVECLDMAEQAEREHEEMIHERIAAEEERIGQYPLDADHFHGGPHA